MENNLFVQLEAGLGIAAVLFAALGIYFFKINESNVVKLEKINRNKYFGGAFALIALVLLEFQLAPLAWSWLVPLLWPLLVILLIVVTLYLDFLFARAAAGLMILMAYYYLNSSFALDIKLSSLGAVFSWTLGGLGIVLSAKPYWLREWMRSCSRRNVVRYLSAMYWWLLALLSVVIGLANW